MLSSGMPVPGWGGGGTSIDKMPGSPLWSAKKKHGEREENAIAFDATMLFLWLSFIHAPHVGGGGVSGFMEGGVLCLNPTRS